MEDLYDILGVKPEASLDEIRERYRFLAMAYHPDRFPNPAMRQSAEAEMKRINMAYSILSDPQQRAAYDQKRRSRAQSKPSEEEKSASTSQTANTESPFEDALQYLASLTIKWQYLAETILKEPNSKILEPLQEIVQLLHILFPRENERQEILSLVITIVLTHIALGAEVATNGIDPRFKKDELETILLQMLVVKLNLTEKDSLWFHQTQKHILERLPALLANVGTLAQAEGAKHAKPAGKTEEAFRKSRANEGGTETTSQRSETSESSTQESHFGFCNACREFEPLMRVTFRKNIGMIFARRYYKVEGDLCGRCIEKYFWSFTATTLFLGWWGVISFLVSPFILLGNIFEYLGALPFVIKHVPGWAKVALGSKIMAILGFIFLCQIMMLYTDTYPSSSDRTAYYRPTSTLVAFNSFNPRSPTETPAPTFTPQPSSTPTRRPTPRRSSSSSFNVLGAPEHCIPWSQVSSRDKGEWMCVYGTVKNIYWDQEGNNHIAFSDSVQAMRFVCHECYFPDLRIGDCVYATSTVKVVDGVPYFVIDELYACR